MASKSSSERSNKTPPPVESPVVDYKPEEDPFVNVTQKMSLYNKIQLIFPGLLFIPFRLTMCLSGLVFVCIATVVCTWGRKKSKDGLPRPFKGKRAKAMTMIIQYSARFILFFLGFHRVKVKGKPAPSKEAPIVVCNHAAPWEGFALAYLHHITYLSAAENGKYPLVGTILRAMQTIFVDRNDTNSRHYVTSEVRRRSADSNWPALVIFPEGTTGNTRSVLAFRTGAFQPGVPVQPVIVKYPWKHMDVSFSGTINIGILLLRMLSQWYNCLEVEFLPVYYPSTQEKEHPQIYADNVRGYMAAMGKLNNSDYNVEDFYLVNEAMKLKIDPTQAVVGMERFKRVLHVGVSDVKAAMKLFKDLDVGRKGKIKVNDFAKALGLPNSDEVQATFARLSEGKEVLDFRQFLTTLSLHSPELTTEEQIRFMFNCINMRGDGKITKEELQAVMFLVSDDMEAKADGVFKKIDAQRRGFIDFIQLGSFIRANPSWMELFEQIRAKQADRLEKKGTNPVVEMLADKEEGKPWTVEQFRKRVVEIRAQDAADAVMEAEEKKKR